MQAICAPLEAGEPPVEEETKVLVDDRPPDTMNRLHDLIRRDRATRLNAGTDD